MSDPTYVYEGTIERGPGGVRTTQLPTESLPTHYGVHGAIAKHYGLDPSSIKEPHAATLDYVISATAA